MALFITGSLSSPGFHAALLYTYRERKSRGQWNWKHSFPSRTEFKNDWSYATAPTSAGMVVLYGCQPRWFCRV